ncbi:MAG: fimbrial protein [Mucinivorans sp.]
MKSLINIMFLATVLLLASCVKEPLDPQLSLGDKDVQIQLLLDQAAMVESRATEIGTPRENYIHSVQLFVFDNLATAPKHTFYVTTNTPTTSAGDVVWISGTKTITIRGKLTATTPYTVYAVVNNDEIAPSTITNAADLTNLVSTSVQPVAEPTDSKGMLMSGEVKDYKFADHNSKMSINLVRQVAKVRFTLKINPDLITKYPLMTFGVDQVQIRTLNVPNKSYIFDQSALPTGVTLADLKPITMAKAGQGWVAQMYLYENMVAGATAQINSTKFIIGLPYSNGTKVTTTNYYLAELATPYQTKRNNIYDVTLTVNGFGSSIPKSDGLSVTTNVLKWNGVDQVFVPDELDILSLSNTSCQIYGDKGVDVVVGQVSLRRGDIVGQLSVTKQGSGFDIVSPTAPVDMTFNSTVDIRVRVTDNPQKGSVELHFGNTTQTIDILTAFDKQQLLVGGCEKAYSDVQWCTLSTAKDYDHTKQKQILFSEADKNIYLNISKATLGETSRVGAIMFTKTDATVTRVVVVQQPYIDVAAVGTSNPAPAKWATGNIGFGYRPDGAMCYVICGARDPGLRFKQGELRGFDYTTTPWSTSDYYYTPSGRGASLSTNRNAGSWVEVNALPPMSADPCSMVYSASGVLWRTPTTNEAQSLVNQRGGNGVPAETAIDKAWGWSNAGHLGQGFNTVDGKLFFPASGLLANDGTSAEFDQEGIATVTVITWISETTKIFYTRPKEYPSAGGDCSIETKGTTTFALPIRCVRAN